MQFFAKNADKSTNALPKGNGTLKVSFIGEHNNQMAGFYRSSYTDAKGEKKIMVSTQFEPLDARRCLPCIDEPAAKAVFRATLIVDAHLTALSNMPEESSTLIEQGKKKKVRFLPSPKMSSYLLAFAVGEFDYIEGKTKHDVIIRVFTPPTKSHLGKFALDVGIKSLDLYDDMFGKPYPLPKLDMIGIPEFAMGAMENWGLVTYREVDVLIDDERASSQQKQRVCTVVAHELAHQWFGNLVTMAWWDDLWLNEGFARWMQNYAANIIKPSWQMWPQFIGGAGGQADALRLDALTTSHPIQVPINRAEEVEQVFDAISYSKGACIVRILYAYLGEENFKKGLQLYMDRHAYKNTQTKDLWQAWQEVSGKPIPEVMTSWTEQMGFPLLIVDKINFNGTHYEFNVEQEWFLADGSKPEGHGDKLWKIPLILSCGEGSTTGAQDAGLMEGKSVKGIKAEGLTKSSTAQWWCKLNGGQHMPVRVLYKDPSDMERLINAIRTKQMCTEDRIGMINDAYALAKAGRIDPGAVVSLLSAYENEDAMPVWDALETVINALSTLLQQCEDGGKLIEAYKKFIARLIVKAADLIGWDDKADDGHLGKLFRGIMIRLQCTFMSEDDKVQKNAYSRYSTFLNDPKGPSGASALPADFKTPVFKLVLKRADISSGEALKRREEMMKILAAADTVADKKYIYFSIGALPSEKLKIEVLDWACETIVLQDFFYAFHSVAGSGPDGAKVCWEYFNKNFEKLFGMVAKASPSMFASIIEACCGGFATEKRAQEIEELFKVHPVPRATRKVAQIVENTKANAKFIAALSASQLLKDVLTA